MSLGGGELSITTVAKPASCWVCIQRQVSNPDSPLPLERLGDEAPAVTLHFPISAYAADDLVASERIGAFLAAHGDKMKAFARKEAAKYL